MTAAINRDRIIEAAGRVYAAHGSRGATTRLIAQEAGVNEVTIFRIFGSKAVLLDEVIRRHSTAEMDGHLPKEPVDPLAELTDWARETLETLRARKSIMRQSMGEVAERPDRGQCVGHTPTLANAELRAYVRRLQRGGHADAVVDPVTPVAMFMGALFADAMGRDMMPQVFPPESRAAAEYARCFLRALGSPTADDRDGRRPAAAARGRSTRHSRTRTL